MPPIGVNDISTAFYNEPRVHDLLLAERLGFKVTYDIRQLIKRNEEELATYGALGARQALTGRRGGRPTKEYWLNEGQALLICALARTTAAARIRRELITVFMAVRSGRPMPTVHVEPQVGEIAAMAEIVDKMRAEVNTLNRKVSSLLGVIEQQGKSLEITSRKAAVKLIKSRVVAGPITPPAALLYGVDAIATYLNLQPHQARSLISMGRIPASRLGRRICCTTEMLDDFMKTMRLPAQKPAVLS
jgi:hypothetical protein